MTDSPRDSEGAKLCAWCGDVIRQSGVGRSRDYCRRSCRQRAYEQRKIDEITQRNAVLIRHQLRQELAPPDSSRDEMTGPGNSSRDETAPRRAMPVVRPGTPQGRSPLLPPPPGATRDTQGGPRTDGRPPRDPHG